MAEQEDMARLLQEANRELEQYGRLTNDTSEKLKYASTGIANFEKKMAVATDAAIGLGKAFVSYNKAVYNGEHGAKASAAALQDLSDAVKQASVGLAVLAPGGVVIKGIILALGFLASKLIETGKEVAEQTGKIFDAFQTIAQAGAAAGDGMQGVFDGLQKMGLGVEQFNAYTKVIEENASDLAAFGHTVAGGRKALEDTVQGLKGFRTDLQIMGLDRTKQVEVTAQYIRQQRLFSQSTKEQMDLSGDAIMRYVKETDKLTRITGANRQEQEKILDKAMSEEIFGAFIDDLEQQGEDGKKRAEAARQAVIMAEKLYGPQAAKAMRDSMTGFVGATDDSKKFLMSFGAEGQNFVDNIRNTNMSQEDLISGFDKMARGQQEQYQGMQKGLAMMGRSENFMLPVKEMRKGAGVINQNLAKAAKEAAGELKKQLEPGSDQRKYAEMLVAQQDEQLALQKTVNLGMSESITVMQATAIANKELAEAALAAARALGMISGTGTDFDRAASASSAGGSVVGGTIVGGAGNVAGESAAIMAASEQGPTKTGIRAEEPRRGQTLGQIATGISDTLAGAMHAIGLRGKEYYLKGKKGGLDERLIDALASVGQEFGKPIEINSGYRSAEDQAQMYKEWVEGGGGPDKKTVNTPTFGRVTTPAKPGQSNHQSRVAVDVDQNIADELERSGLLAKHGLVRPYPHDPVHIQLEKFEFGGMLGAGKMGIAGEAGAELITGPASITPMNDLMRELGSLNQISGAMLVALKDIARKQGEAVDTSKRMLQVAQN